MKELKGFTVDAEELYKVIYDSKLTSESKVMVIAARLHEGSLPRNICPSGRGLGDYDSARNLLRQQRKASAPSANARILELFEDTYPKLTPKATNVKSKPAKSSVSEPAAAVEPAAKNAGADSSPKK